MNGNGTGRKLFGAMAFVIWSAIVLSAFYITQRPLFFQVASGIGSTLWAIALTIILLANSAGLGYFTVRRMRLEISGHERFILGTGLGLGAMGLIGYGLGAAGLASVPFLAVLLLGLLLWILFSKTSPVIWSDLQSLINSFRLNRDGIPAWLPPAVFITALLGFFFALLPPAEGFDGLFYHLTMPERLIEDGKILPHNILQFWFPSLIEGDFLLALGLGSERTAQLIHWSFSMLTLALIWEWSRKLFGHKSAWWTLAILISMPSLPWISSWAYTDLALTFVGFAGLYTLWRWSDARENGWLIVAGLFAGMAMGIKYTSFILPMFCVLLILLWEKNFHSRIIWIIRFSIPALLGALPWYLRNWLVMGNPFYPFVFGGRFWDAFRTDWYNGTGTGIGWDWREILLLPFTITLGHRDQNFYDGRIGPLFLLLIPLALWILWKKRAAAPAERKALLIISAFFGLNFAFWTFGVIQTASLWQSRLLWPGLIPFTIPIGLGISHLADLDLPRLRISFIATSLIALVIAVTLLDNSLSLIFRRPLVYALGMETRQAYFERIQPRYSQALELVGTTPGDAYVYFIFEPRSYTMPRKVQPDPINDNLMHDYYLFETPDAILDDWRSKGYTHVLVYFPGLELVKPANEGLYTQQLEGVLKNLQLESELEDYRLYSIP
jgi:hypothetical protein